MSVETPHIFRLPNGAIDIDHYRKDAAIERRRAFSRSSKSIGGVISVTWPVLALGLIVATALTAAQAPAARTPLAAATIGTAFDVR